jgi:hypothetical protein
MRQAKNATQVIVSTATIDALQHETLPLVPDERRNPRISNEIPHDALRQYRTVGRVEIARSGSL